jgi:hypothetical protein
MPVGNGGLQYFALQSLIETVSAHVMSGLECGFFTENSKPFNRTPSFVSVRTCVERLKNNSLESEAEVDKIIVVCSNVAMQRSQEGTCFAWYRLVNTSTKSELSLGNRT